MKLSHKAIASNPKLALDWLIMQGYTRRRSVEMLAKFKQTQPPG